MLANAMAVYKSLEGVLLSYAAVAFNINWQTNNAIATYYHLRIEAICGPSRPKAFLRGAPSSRCSMAWQPQLRVPDGRDFNLGFAKGCTEP